MAADDPQAQWLPARYFRVGRLAGPPSLIVLHSTEGPIRPGAARAVASWWHGASSPKTSAHYTVDGDEVWQSVAEADTAWAAGARGNRLGIHVELVGYALRTDWSSGDGCRVLERARALCRHISERTGISWAALCPDGLIAGCSGLTTHASVTEAWGESTHVDPGGPGDKRWPWSLFLAWDPYE